MEAIYGVLRSLQLTPNLLYRGFSRGRVSDRFQAPPNTPRHPRKPLRGLALPAQSSIPLLFYIYRDKQLKWRWRLFSSAGMRIIAISGESYEKKMDCLDSIELIAHGVQDSIRIEEPEPEAE